MATEIVVPKLGESVSEATVARWLKKVGDVVAVDQPLVELETDKVTLEVNATVAGTLSEIKVPAGTSVAVGAVLGSITEGAVKAAPSAPKASATTSPSPLPAKPQKPVAAEVLSPAVRKLVTEHQVEPSAVTGTGKDGRLTKGDVLAHLEHRPAAAQPQANREQRVRMTRLRQKIAERLKAAQNTAAILTTFNEVDMTNIMNLRNQYKEPFEKKYGVKLGFMAFFVKASINALKEIPAVNAEIDGTDIVYKNFYDIGVAVGTEQGLVVPVVRNADQMNFAEIEMKINELGKRARDGKLALEELAGGTFTISNGGVYGSLLSTPILNPPQSGILGMHKIQERPVAVNGKIEIRPMMYLAFSYDHRIIDGREAVTFLLRLKEALEDPQRLLLGV